MSNRERDRAVRERLLESGWRHLIVWECSLRGRHRLGVEETTGRIVEWLLDRQLTTGEVSPRFDGAVR